MRLAHPGGTSLIERALRAMENIGWDSLTWKPKADGSETMDLFVLCGNVFGGDDATDGELLTPENIGLLERTCAEVRAAEGANPRDPIFADMLFCGRVRKTKPSVDFLPEDESPGIPVAFLRKALDECPGYDYQPTAEGARPLSAEASTAWGELAERILRATARPSASDSLLWRARPWGMEFFLSHDAFGASPDATVVTALNVDMLEAAFREVAAHNGSPESAVTLFAACEAGRQPRGRARKWTGPEEHLDWWEQRLGQITMSNKETE